MDILILIMAMAVVTLIPRVLPAIFLDRVKLGKKAEDFLSYIHYTAMIALVFPGVVTMDKANMSVGIAGALMAALLGWQEKPVMLVVLGSVLVVLVTYLVFG